MAIFGATATAESAKLFQAGSATATFYNQPMLLIGVTVQVQRQLSPVPTLTDGIVWSAQPVSGTLTAQGILMAEDVKAKFDALTGDACKPIPITVTLSAGACAGAGVTLEIKDGFCSSVQFTANGNQGYVGSDLTIQFTTCEIKGNA